MMPKFDQLPTVFTLPPDDFEKFVDAINNPKPPNAELTELMRGTKAARLKRIAKAMEARRAELINQPLARIWDELAKVAIEADR